MRALAFAAAAAFAISCTAVAEPARPVTGGAPVVVELFTSQGCSSCPPADRLLSQLAKDGAAAGRAIVPLAFHVDYWNDLGWDDPFSKAAWSARQGVYAKAGRVYTPQLVIAGGRDALGSDRDAIEHAVAQVPAQLAIAATAAREGATLHVTATAPAGADVYVAVWEDGVVTDVRRGENAGERLASDRIVRALTRVARAGHAGAIDVALDPSWKQLGAVAFAQRPDLAIVGATVLAARL
jgi:hypothetical protein